MRDSAGLNCRASNCLFIYSQSAESNGREGTQGEQGDESSLEALLEEDPLLAFGPVDVVLKYGRLDVVAVGDGGEEVKEGSDFSGR
jgi:hypothetical protein